MGPLREKGRRWRFCGGEGPGGNTGTLSVNGGSGKYLTIGHRLRLNEYILCVWANPAAPGGLQG